MLIFLEIICTMVMIMAMIMVMIIVMIMVMIMVMIKVVIMVMIMVIIQPGAAGRRCHWRVRGGEVSPAKPGGRSSLSIFVLPLQRMFIRMMDVANMRICASMCMAIPNPYHPLLNISQNW